MLVFQVNHYIQPDKVEAYKSAILENARITHTTEPGVLRFDVFQSTENPTHFFLMEIYQDEAAREAHLATAHVKAWGEVYFATREKQGEGGYFDLLASKDAE